MVAGTIWFATGWLADECIDAALVARLRSGGHDVVYMAEIAPAASDVVVMARP